jgi:hypothetical protein
VWSVLDIANGAAAGLRKAETRLAAEHAVYGLDALDEVGLHPILAEGLRDAGFGVWSEQPFPGEVERRLARRSRERCDLVLTNDPQAGLIEPVTRLRNMDAAAGTLFGIVADESPPEPARVTEVGEAYWLEVKTVAQWAYVHGVPQANRQYAAQLIAGPEKDLLKLAREPRVCFGGSLVVLFCDARATAEHDLIRAVHTLLDRGVPVGTPELAWVDIEDRAGNAVCAAALLPARL